eukprot:COSAG06_NODE_1279_length_10030_cov_65.663679_3_plen_178_part_00
MREQLLVAGAISFALYLMNVLIILFVCWMVFMLKAVEFRNLMRDDSEKSRDQTYRAMADVAAGGGGSQQGQSQGGQGQQGGGGGRGALTREMTVGDFSEYLYGEEPDETAVDSPSMGETAAEGGGDGGGLMRRMRSGRRVKSTGDIDDEDDDEEEGDGTDNDGSKKKKEQEGQCVIS